MYSLKRGREERTHGRGKEAGRGKISAKQQLDRGTWAQAKEMWMARGRRKCSSGVPAMSAVVRGQRSRWLWVQLRAMEEMGSVVEEDARW